VFGVELGSDRFRSSQNRGSKRTYVAVVVCALAIPALLLTGLHVGLPDSVGREIAALIGSDSPKSTPAPASGQRHRPRKTAASTATHAASGSAAKLIGSTTAARGTGPTQNPRAGTPRGGDGAGPGSDPRKPGVGDQPDGSAPNGHSPMPSSGTGTPNAPATGPVVTVRSDGASTSATVGAGAAGAEVTGSVSTSTSGQAVSVSVDGGGASVTGSGSGSTSGAGIPMGSPEGASAGGTPAGGGTSAGATTPGTGNVGASVSAAGDTTSAVNTNGLP
jgi:hypothetical protein